MAKLTNAQLLSELTTLRVHCNHVETQRDSLRDSLAAALKRIDELNTTAAKPRSTVRAAYVAPHDAALEERHANYVRALIAAREEAARTGRVVRVL